MSVETDLPFCLGALDCEINLSELQIRWGFENISEIIFLISH